MQESQYAFIDKLQLHWQNKLKAEEITSQLSLYIPTTLGLTEKDDIEKRLIGISEIGHFLNSDKKALLLLGDSGAGKSLFGLWLVNHLWEKKDRIIPLFIHLPSIKIKKGFLEKYLTKNCKLTIDEIENLRTTSKLFIVLDSYDEMSSEYIGKNAFRIGKLFNWNAQVMISCRTEALVKYSNNDQVDMFCPFKDERSADIQGLEKRYVQFFDPKTQVPQYIDQWKSHNLDLVDPTLDYLDVINKLPGLAEMITNPFILMIVMPALPKLLKSYLAKPEIERFDLTRMALYDAFTSAWFLRQKNKLIDNEMIDDVWAKTIESDFFNYCEQLANKMWQCQTDRVIFDMNNEAIEKLWGPFFGSNRFFDEDNKKPINIVRQGALLRIVDGKTYTFLHKSLLEYFAAKKLFESAANKASVGIGLELNAQLITNPAIIRFGADCISQNPTFEEALWSILEESKHEVRVQVAAANAITILNAANRSFANKDFRRIRISFANVSGGNFEGADLQDSDLRNVDFTGAWLTRANLSGSCVDKIRTTALQGEKFDSAVVACVMSPNTKQYIVVTDKTSMIYDSETHTVIKNDHHYGNKPSVKVVGDKFKLCLFNDLHFEEASFGRTGNRFQYLTFEKRLEAMSIYVSHRTKGSLKVSSLTPEFIKGYVAKEVIDVFDIELVKDKKELTHAVNARLLPHIYKKFDIRLEAIPDLVSSESDVVNKLLNEIILILKIEKIFQYLDITSITTNNDNYSTFMKNPFTYAKDPVFVLAFFELLYRRFDINRFFNAIDNFAMSLSELEDCEPEMAIDTISFYVLAILFKVDYCFWTKDDEFILSREKLILTKYLFNASDHFSDMKISHILLEVVDKKFLINEINLVNFNNHDWKNLHSSDPLFAYEIPQNHYFFKLVEMFDGMLALKYSADKKWLLINHQVKGFIIYNTLTNEQNIINLNSAITDPDAIIYSSDASWFLTGLTDGTIKRWDTATGQCISNWIAHQVSVMTLNNDNTLLLSGSLDGTIKLWRIHNGECTATLSGHSTRITAIAIAADNSWVVSGSADGILKRWELGVQQLLLGNGHQKRISSLFISSDKSAVISESEDLFFKRWNVANGQCLETQLGTVDELVKIKCGIVSQAVPGKLIWLEKWQGLNQNFNCYYIHSDGSWALTGNCDGTISYWPSKNSAVHNKWLGHQAAVTAITTDSSGLMAFSGDNNGKVMIWDVFKGQSIGSCGILNSISSIKWFSLRAYYIIVGMSDGSLTLWKFNPRLMDICLEWRTRPWSLQANNAKFLGVYGLTVNQGNELELSGAQVQISTKKSEAIIDNRNIPVYSYDAKKDLKCIFDSQKSLRPGAWAISIVRKTTKEKSEENATRHAFLVLESVENNHYIIRRIDFVLELRHEFVPKDAKEPKKSDLFGQGLVEVTEKSIDDMVALIKQSCFISSGITADQGNKLLENIRNDQANPVGYCIGGNGNIYNLFRIKNANERHNCLSWCEKHLALIGVNLTKKIWLDGLVNLPALKLVDKAEDQKPQPATDKNSASPRPNNNNDEQEPTSGSHCALM